MRKGCQSIEQRPGEGTIREGTNPRLVEHQLIMSIVHLPTQSDPDILNLPLPLRTRIRHRARPRSVVRPRRRQDGWSVLESGPVEAVDRREGGDGLVLLKGRVKTGRFGEETR